MDTIAFADDGGPDIGVRIIINARELVELAREAELPYATREGHPDIAGAYGYFGPMFVFSPARHFYGEPAHDWTDGNGRIYVLSCSCGIPECWALSARVVLSDTEVIWADFRQTHRGPLSVSGQWRYDSLGPFIFDRRAYDKELAKTPAVRTPRPPQRTRNTRLAEVFNLGFRRGANDRAAAGIVLGSERTAEPAIPPAPMECGDEMEREAWLGGYRAGHTCGASDAELEGVEIPGANGLITGFDQKFLERFGFLQGVPDHALR